MVTIAYMSRVLAILSFVPGMAIPWVSVFRCWHGPGSGFEFSVVLFKGKEGDLLFIWGFYLSDFFPFTFQFAMGS